MANFFSRLLGSGGAPREKTLVRAADATPAVKPAVAPAVNPKPDIEGYKVERELGSGGMGTVWLVSDVKDPKLRFALKRCHADESLRRLFEAELQIWIGLQEHANLVACRFFRSMGDELLIFAEYVDGSALGDHFCYRMALEPEDVLDAAIQFAWGLHAAHEQGVIHQDVKPSNAMITRKGEVKVTDFGLTRLSQPRTGLGSDTQVVEFLGGDVGYCSPEQARGDLLTQRSDLWSWGVAVMELFVGQRTGRRGDLAAQELESLLQHQAQGAPELTGRPRMPEAVAAVLRRCFEDEPDKRWPTLLSAAYALEDAYKACTGKAAGLCRRCPSPGRGS